MDKRIYNKLVRDRVPEAIVAGGDDCVHKVIDDDKAFLEALDEKLDEELAEYQTSKDIDKLADVLEVIYAICEAHDLNFKDLEQIRLDKRARRGGFTKKFLLKEIHEKR